jgi:hypothetical protein
MIGRHTTCPAHQNSGTYVQNSKLLPDYADLCYLQPEPNSGLRFDTMERAMHFFIKDALTGFGQSTRNYKDRLYSQGMSRIGTFAEPAVKKLAETAF